MIRVVAAIALVGCAPGSADVRGSSSTEPALAPLSADADAAFDPLRAPLGWSVRGKAGSPVTVSIVAGETELWSMVGAIGDDGTLAGTWDASADPPELGALTLVVDDGLRTATDGFAAVRPGLVTAHFGGDDRQVLFWRGGRTLQDPSVPVSTTADVTAFPAVSGDLVKAPEDGSAEPVAYSWDAHPQLILEVPTTTDLGGTGLEDAAVAVEITGWSALGDATLVPGGTVTLELDEPLSDSVGLTELDLHLRFTTPDGARTIEIGEQLLPVRIYRVLGPHTTGFQTDDGNPWIAAIDPALRGIDGTAPSHDAVADALVDWIYNDLGLSYDTAAGASFYSDYSGFSWDQPLFFLSDFLVRRNGTVINCSDSGNILATHANMLGAELMHIVILENYQLNEIKGIGLPGFSSCPFGPWGCGFSYHAVTTDDPGAAVVWDTTLALDGDANPSAAPSTELLVQSIPGAEYLSRLVRSGSAGYAYPGQVVYE